MTLVRKDWLKLTEESVIDPDLSICDPHHHLWYQSDNDYTLEDLRQDIAGGHRVVQTVFVESCKMLRKDGPPEFQPVGETEFIQDAVSRQTGDTVVAAGIVGFVDLVSTASAAAPVLEAHIEAGKGRFRGIRYTAAWDASPQIKSSSRPGILADPRFREGFACLGRYGLSFDAWLYHPQLMELVDLAKTFPDTVIIVDHIGGPLGDGPYAGKRDEVFREWQKGIAALADCGNVFMKLGGLGMGINGFGWYEKEQPPGSIALAEAFAPYFLWCIEKFGVNRSMFESNFPVDKRSYSYTILWNAFKRIAKDFSSEEKRALFHDTAAKAYRLPVL